MKNKEFHKTLQKELFNSIAIKVKRWLGPKGISLFRRYKRWTGTVSPVFGIKENRSIPHPVHFREGMQVRNFLRTLPECRDWSSHDLDNNWAAIVDRALEI